MNEREAIAAIRIVGAVARADGKIDDQERIAFRQAIAEFNPKLPDGTDVARLLEEEVDVDAELAEMKSPVLQKAVFEAAIAMSLVDGTPSNEENALLARIRSAFSVERDQSLLDRALHNRQIEMQGEPVLEPQARAARVDSIIAQRSVIAGVFGALPLPVVSEVGVLLQIDALIGGIAMAYGHPLTRKERVARFGAVVSVAVAQSAVHSLLKLIPGWGSAAGAIGGGFTAYVVTRSLGGVVRHHFERDGQTTPAELKQLFKDEKAVAKKAYEDDKATVDKLGGTHADAIAALTTKLEKNEITVEEFDAQVAELVRASPKA